MKGHTGFGLIKKSLGSIVLLALDFCHVTVLHNSYNPCCIINLKTRHLAQVVFNPSYLHLSIPPQHHKVPLRDDAESVMTTRTKESAQWLGWDTYLCGRNCADKDIAPTHHDSADWSI